MIWERVYSQDGGSEQIAYRGTDQSDICSEEEAREWMRLKEQSHRERGWEVSWDGEVLEARKSWDYGRSAYRRMWIRPVA